QDLPLLQRISSKKPALVAAFAIPLEGDRSGLPSHSHSPVPTVIRSRSGVTNSLIKTANPLTAAAATVKRDCGNYRVVTRNACISGSGSANPTHRVQWASENDHFAGPVHQSRSISATCFDRRQGRVMPPLRSFAQYEGRRSVTKKRCASVTSIQQP